VEEGRPVGISALAGLLFAVAAAGVALFLLLLVSGQGHPVFSRVEPDLRRLLFVALPLASVLASVLASGLIGLRRWAWWGTAALLATSLAIALTALGFKFRVWRVNPATTVARDEFLAQGCWAFLFGVFVVYMLTAAALDAFQMKRRMMLRAVIAAYVGVAVASGFPLADEIREFTISVLRSIARRSAP
jgi:hypothetical protein